MRPIIVWLVVVCLASTVHAANFTIGAADAAKFGAHEIVLTGNGAVTNPFDTVATVRFTPPGGAAQAVTVHAFYDGGNTWRARLYVTQAGPWSWASSCASDPGLDGKSGAFKAADSKLRGMLRKHVANPRAWMTDDGQTFLNISDTGYRLFHGKDAPLWREFINDAAGKGINCVRSASLGGWGGTPGAAKDDNNTWVWNDPWAGGAKPDHSRYDLEKFRATDGRLIWILENHPELYIQFILFSFKGYGGEGTGKHWESLSPAVRQNTMRYMIARWSAFPNLFWLIVNDMHSSGKFPKNQAFVREVGAYFAANDPFKHLLSTGPNRRAGFAFTTPEDLKWCSYIHIEDAYALGADQIQQHQLASLPLHVWLAEDYYEQDHGRFADARYFYRWLFWSWLLSGGSANYAGRWGPIHPYSMTGRPDLPWKGIDGKTTYTGEQLVGLDSVQHIPRYVHDRKLDVARFQPADGCATDLDGRTGRLRPKAMARGGEEIVIYHPNAAIDGRNARVDVARTARLRVDLKDAKGTFEVEWLRALDGATQGGAAIEGGAERELVAPWKGQDVVVRLRLRREARAECNPTTLAPVVRE